MTQLVDITEFKTLIEVVSDNASDDSHTLLPNTYENPSKIFPFLMFEMLKAVQDCLDLNQGQLESLRIEIPTKKSSISA